MHDRPFEPFWLTVTIHGPLRLSSWQTESCSYSTWWNYVQVEDPWRNRKTLTQMVFFKRKGRAIAHLFLCEKWPPMVSKAEKRELKQRRRTSTGSESFSLSTRLDDIKFVLLCFVTMKETIWLKIFGETTAQECKKSTSGWRASLKLPKHYSTSLPHSPPATHTHKHAPTIHCEPSSCAQVTIRKRLHYKVRVNGNGL